MHCVKCGISFSVPGIKMHKGQICSECHKLNTTNILRKFQKQKETDCLKMEAIFKDLEKKVVPYHALVTFSGGKDSAIVLYLLKKKYHLRPLAASLIYPWTASKARENCETIAKNLNVDLIFYEMDFSFLINITRYGLAHYGKYRLNEESGCIFCEYSHRLPLYLLASKMQIPLFCTGGDLTQIPEIMPGIIEGDTIKVLAEETGYWFQEKHLHQISRDLFESQYEGSLLDNRYEAHNLQTPATIVNLFKILDNINPKEYYDLLENEKIWNSEDMIPYKTNCTIKYLYDFWSFKTFGCPSTAKQIHRPLRHGLPSNLQGWFGNCDIDFTDPNNHIAWEKEYKDLLIYVAHLKKTDDIPWEDLNKKFPFWTRWSENIGWPALINRIKESFSFSDALNLREYLDIKCV